MKFRVNAVRERSQSMTSVSAMSRLTDGEK